MLIVHAIAQYIYILVLKDKNLTLLYLIAASWYSSIDDWVLTYEIKGERVKELRLFDNLRKRFT